ncbi:MAG: MMPL family transporter, partial [Thiohalocapsa sp.]
MLRSSIIRLVDLCARHAWPVIAIALALAVLSGTYAVQHFAIKTDINDLFPRNLPWTERAFAFMKTFPQRDITIVVDAPTAEYADVAAGKLAAALREDKAHIRSVEAAQGGAFFAQNGLLYLPTDQLAKIAGGMQQAGPLLGTLAADPSLRGALGALSYGLMGVANGVYSLDDLAPAMDMASNTIEDVLAGRPGQFSWRALAAGAGTNAGGKAGDKSELRRFIRVTPVRDFTALQPGRAATDAINAAAAKLNLAGDYQAQVRLTGMVPIDDDQFATLTEHVVLNGIVAIVAVVIILWLALRSWRIIFAALVSVVCGLAMAAALGLFLVGALNLISVAFFVLFIGLGVDFGIQFAVRYRAERHDSGALHPALLGAAAKAGAPLALAAAATAIGFAAFVPTPYRGLGELGLIAGPGMLIAFAMSVTLLPAMLAVLKPPGEPHAMGFAALAPVDRFLQRRRVAVVGGTAAIVLLASPLLLWLPFDFDPIHLSSPKAPSVATYLELRKDPQTGANAIEVVAPSVQAADADAARLGKLPQVARTTTISSFIPADQDAKLALIRRMAAAIGDKLNPKQTLPPPTDQQTIEALLSTGISLSQFAAMGSGGGAHSANRLFQLLLQLAKADPAARERVATAVVTPLQISLAGRLQHRQHGRQQRDA